MFPSMVPLMGKRIFLMFFSFSSPHLTLLTPCSTLWLIAPSLNPLPSFTLSQACPQAVCSAACKGMLGFVYHLYHSPPKSLQLAYVCSVYRLVDDPLYLKKYKLYCTRCRQRWAGNDKGNGEFGIWGEKGLSGLACQREDLIDWKRISRLKRFGINGHEWLRQKLWCSPLRKSDFRTDRQTKKKKCTGFWGIAKVCRMTALWCCIMVLPRRWLWLLLLCLLLP